MPRGHHQSLSFLSGQRRVPQRGLKQALTHSSMPLVLHFAARSFSRGPPETAIVAAEFHKKMRSEHGYFLHQKTEEPKLDPYFDQSITS